MDEIESRTGDQFSLAIAHHAFMNTVVLRDVNRRRVADGRPRMTLLCFAHGTELKMFNNERRGDEPDEFPLRFLPFMQRERIFDFADPEHGIDLAAAISVEQVDALLDVFPEFPRERVVLSPNGYNQDVFLPLPDGTDRAAVLAGFFTQPLDGSDPSPKRSRHRKGSTPSSPSAASSPTGSGWTRCSARQRSTNRTSAEFHARDRLRATRGPARHACAEHRARVTPHLLPRAAPQDELARCSAAPTSAASPPTVNRSDSSSSSAWPAALR